MRLTIIALFCSMFAWNLQAQDDLPTESVDVIKDFEVRLLESTKIDVSPTLPALDTSTQTQNYAVQARPISVSYEAPKLRPVGIKRDKNEKVYPGYARLGAGVPTSFLGEAGYYFASKEALSGKVWAKHHSANATSVENQRFMDNEIGISTAYNINKTTAVEGNVGYDYDRVHYYGYPQDSLTFDKSVVRQDFKMFHLGGRFFNTEGNEADLNFSVAPNFYYLSDFFGNKETGLDLNVGGTKWFSDKHPFRVNLRTDFTRFSDTVTYNLNNIYIQPSFTLHLDFLRLKIGGNFVSNRDVFTIFPDVEATLRVWGDGVQVFGGATGDLRKNTFRTLTEYNQFVNPRIGKLVNTEWRNYFGGLKGNLGFLSYSAQVGYGKAKQMALFTPNFEQPYVRFDAIYDTVQVFNIQGNIKVNPTKDLTLMGTLSQSIFDTSNEAKAWGIPGLEGNFSAIYSLLEGKASARADLYMADKIAFQDELNVNSESKALVDLSLGGTYRVTDNVGIFLDVNNLLNNRRERWYRYPTFGTNILGGVHVRF